MIFPNFKKMPVLPKKILMDTKSKSLYFVQNCAQILILSIDTIGLLISKLTVFLELLFWKTVGFLELIMFTDKYPGTFCTKWLNDMKQPLI